MQVSKMFKKFFALTLSLALTLSCVTPAIHAVELEAAPREFPDVKSTDYFYEAVENLSSKDILIGYENGTFRPEEPVTREQAAKIISLALGLSSPNTQAADFNDVKESDYFYPYIAALAGRGILEGHGDGSFKPGDSLTRAQIAKILSKAFELGEEKLGKGAFKDVVDSDWFSIYLPTLIQNKITLGATEDTYDPEGTVTRAQIAAFVHRCLSMERSLSGWVHADMPVSAAVISFYDTDGNKIPMADVPATDSYGAILGGASESLPSDFRVIAEGGSLGGEEFVGKLSVDIRGFNPYSDIIYINPVTSLVSAYLDKYPEASLAEAEIALRGFLKIPESIELSSGTQLSSEYFNNSQFLREARENGGINPFIDILLAEMDALGTHPFKEALPQAGAASWLAKTLAEGAVSYVGGELMGWGLAKAGIGFGEEDHTAEELAKINKGMEEMKSQLSKMGVQLDAISTKLDNIIIQLDAMLKELSHKLALNEYGSRVGQLNTLISSVDSIQRDLKNFVKNPPSNPETVRQSLIGRIERNIVDSADVIHNQLVGIGGQKPLITLWREVAYENRFLGWEDYSRVEAQFDYFKEYQEAILLLQVEYYHAIEGAPEENTDIIMGCINRYNEHIKQQEALLVLPIKEYTVVDSKSDNMYRSENIVFGSPSPHSYFIGGRESYDVEKALKGIASNAWDGYYDWKPLDLTGLSPLITDQKPGTSPWFISEHLVNNGWPGEKYTGSTVIPYINNLYHDEFSYLLYTGYLSKKMYAYPEKGLQEPDLAMLMIYREVTAEDYGYGHLKG